MSEWGSGAGGGGGGGSVRVFVVGLPSSVVVCSSDFL